jgi:hypothetical protein
MSINRVGFNFTGPLGAMMVGCVPSNIDIWNEVVIFVVMGAEAFQLGSSLENLILV